LAVPTGKIAIGVGLPTSRRATLPTVPSPPATAMTPQLFLSAFFQSFSFEDVPGGLDHFDNSITRWLGVVTGGGIMNQCNFNGRLSSTC
jgi:hypothetical protein